MLPDYPSQKRELMKILTRRFAEIVTGGFMREIQRTFVEEGSENEITRSDQTKEAVDFQHISAGFEIHESEADTLTAEQVLAKFEGAAIEMRAEMERMMFQAVERAVEQTGNVVMGKGGITPEVILEMTEKVDMAFEDGQPQFPQMVLAPQMIEQAKASIQEIENNPEYQRRMEEIVERKRNEWAAREADYKLVG